MSTLNDKIVDMTLCFSYPCREVLPIGMIALNCHLYKELVIDNGSTVHRVIPADDLTILYDNNEKAGLKLHYCELRRGKLIILAQGCGFNTSYAACLMGIMYYREQPYIAHLLPLSSIFKSYEGTNFNTTTVTDSLNYTVLYLCPVDRFISDIQLLNAGDGNYILVT